MKYDKLVRDKLPDAIRQKGNTPITHTANDVEFFDYLKKKLIEEAKEFIVDSSEEELADILEVIHAIIEFQGKNFADVETLRLEKRETKGGYDQKIILEEIED